MKFSTTLKTTFKHIERNSWFSFGSILIIALTFFITSLILILNYVVGIALDDFEKKGQIAVFFQPATEESYIIDLKDELEATGKTSSIIYVSETQAVKNFLEWNDNDPTLEEILDDGILPASLHINTNKLENLDEIVTMLENEAAQNDYIDSDIRHNKNIADILIEVNKSTKVAGIVGFAIMAVISLLIILITITTNIRAHSQEIEIMQLVGGGDWHIRLPFILEGAFYGFVGAVLSTVILLAVYYLSLEYWQTSATIEFIKSYFGDLEWPAINMITLLKYVSIKLLIASLIGATSSFLAVIKYLK